MLVSWSLADFDKIEKNIVVYRLGWMRHVDLALKFCLLCEIWESSTMVYMEMSHKQDLYFSWVYLVEVRQRLNALSAWVHAAVKHDFASFEL